MQVISSLVKLDHESFLATYFQTLAEKNSIAANLKITLEKSGKVFKVDWDAHGRTTQHIATSSLNVKTFAADSLVIELELNGEVVYKRRLLGKKHTHTSARDGPLCNNKKKKA